MGPLGVPELIFIFVMALLIFGPKKLPQLGKTFGKSMAEFRRASNDLRNTFQREMDSIERETQEVNQEVKKVTQEVKKDLDTSNYDDGEDDYYSDYDQTPYEDKSSSNASSTPASQDTDTAKASTNGNDAKASAASNDGTPPDEAPSTVDKSTDAAEVKTT